MMKNLQGIFLPRSIAVIGASVEKGKVGNTVFSSLLLGGFKGILFPVNHKRESIMGVKCYPDILSIPEPVDLAILVVPNKICPQILRECGKKKVKGAIIVSAGFKEIGKKGKKLEEEILRIAHQYNLVLLGPNCLGLINTDPVISMNATFARFMPEKGNIAFISQSGALCTAVLDYAKGKNMGFSKFISMGNKAHLNEVDLLLYLKDDPKTKVILIYLENITDPLQFMKIAREITSRKKDFKPIIAIKSGRTSKGAKAALSHTGALAASDEIYSALLAQSGVLRVETVEELFDNAKAFANVPLPQGNRIAIITNAGGPGIMAVDSSIKCGLKIARLEDRTKKKLRQALPSSANIDNPVDIIGDARHERYQAALSCILEDKNVDGVIVILTPQAMTNIEEIAQVIVEEGKKSKKPILCCFMGCFDVSRGIEILGEGNIPNYQFLESPTRVLRDMYKYKEWTHQAYSPLKKFRTDREKAARIIRKANKDERFYLPEIESIGILNAYGFPTLKSVLAKDVDECISAADKIGYPVAMKIVSPDIIHKFEVGGVLLKLKDASEVKRAYLKMRNNVKKLRPHARVWGMNIQEMAKGGQEVILGAKRDSFFGPIIMFGLGGVYVETIKDISFGFIPLRPADALKIIKSIKTFKILSGIRGKPPYDISAIVDCLLRLSQLIMENESISELDINPLIVYPEGCKVADVRIILSEKSLFP